MRVRRTALTNFSGYLGSPDYLLYDTGYGQPAHAEIVRDNILLISHRKKFIFTKTLKTAGTSIESYFEKYCMPAGKWRQSHLREEYVSESGVIGYRGRDARGSSWYNHMPAREIRARVGTDIWASYFKFTVIRNPFDKLISGFLMYEMRNRRPGKGDSSAEVQRFRSWVRGGGTVIDRNKYLIDGRICVDFFIRFEALHQGLEKVCDFISIPYQPAELPAYKMGNRTADLRIRDYYDKPTEVIVRKNYAWEIENFAYDLTDQPPK